MRVFEVSVVTSLVALGSLAGFGVAVAQADFTFGELVNLGATINTGEFSSPCSSADGLELYLTHDRFVGNDWVGADIYVARRATLDGEWDVPVSLGESVNATDPDMLYAANWLPCISANGLSLYFTHDAGEAGRIYVAKRATKQDNWGTPVSVGMAVNAEAAWQPYISADELELYFHSDRPGGHGESDLYVTTRASVNDEWGAPVNLGPTVNSPAWDNSPSISPDGLLLSFGSTRPGGLGDFDVYVARRTTKTEPWGPAINAGPIINSALYAWAPKISFDGSLLYFMSDRVGGYPPAELDDIWRASILPVVDFNADGKVDLADLVALIDHWGTDNTLYDIGPYAWGDGKVDIQDLKAFVGQWEKQNPPAQP